MMDTVQQRLTTAWDRARTIDKRLTTLATTRPLTVTEVRALISAVKLQTKIIIRMESDYGEAQHIISQIAKGVEMVEKELDEIEQELKGAE